MLSQLAKLLDKGEVLRMSRSNGGERYVNPTFTLNSMFFLLYKQLRLTPAVPVYYRFSL